MDTNTIQRSGNPSPARENGLLHAVQAPTPEQFAQRLIGDFTGLASSLMAAIGDRLGLFKALASGGPATATELASQTQTHERYLREWLGAMASTGYVEYDATTRRFSLPPAHAPLLADERSAMFFGGAYQQWLGLVRVLDDVSRAFRDGGGVSFEAYGQDFWQGTERFTSTWFDHLLVQQWLPAAPEARSALERGVRLADVGCGRGRALIRLAQAFPASHFVGYDLHAPSIAAAARAADAAGVSQRVRFQQQDVTAGLPEPYEVITAFDVVHDAVDPRALLQAIRNALRDGGTFLCLEFNAREQVAEQIKDPMATLGYTISTLFCMTTSLAHDGQGLGALGLNERRLREWCMEVGFKDVRRAQLDIPFNVLYVISG